ncbi:MAG TPA: SGNH hydrolase domain-containing protein [Solirubrobacteraceae bacterium]|jgi:hypothetical protein|nr:SGNH hydrolase domain-containing protein [Solirubrobacteraceae bacterium]
MRRLAVAIAAAAAVLGMAGTSAGQDSPERMRCFGAAARDRERPCVNRALRLTVFPTPQEARGGLNSPCEPIRDGQAPYSCAFGAHWEGAVKTIGLVGDSHAAHWRAALDVAARRRGWHGISLTETGCSLTKATPVLKGRRRDDCVAYNRALVTWLESHPQVETLFTSQHGGKVMTAPGQSQEDAQTEGFLRAVEELPPTVRQVVVIRDTPWSSRRTPACVTEAVLDRRRPDRACALPRERALRRDVAAEVARRLRSPRLQLVNLTPFMCDRTRCFPVVGGALVHKDAGHITQVFSRTLGPYLGRALDRLPPPAP